jgi:hypothetical protein
VRIGSSTFTSVFLVLPGVFFAPPNNDSTDGFSPPAVVSSSAGSTFFFNWKIDEADLPF